MELNIIIDAFLDGNISAQVFEEKYMKAWRKARDGGQLIKMAINDRYYFDAVFCAIDNYCPNPALRNEGEFDDDLLLLEVRRIKAKLDLR